MKVVWSQDRSAVKIYGDYSPHPIIVTAEVCAMFNEDCELVFHTINNYRKRGFLPRANSSECNPFNKMDIRLAMANEFLNCRFWVYGTLYPTVHEYVRGYYKREGNDAVFLGGTVVKDYFK